MCFVQEGKEELSDFIIADQNITCNTILATEVDLAPMKSVLKSQ